MNGGRLPAFESSGRATRHNGESQVVEREEIPKRSTRRREFIRGVVSTAVAAALPIPGESLALAPLPGEHAYQEFLRRTLTDVARGLGMSYDELAGAVENLAHRFSDPQVVVDNTLTRGRPRESGRSPLQLSPGEGRGPGAEGDLVRSEVRAMDGRLDVEASRKG